MGSHDKGTEGRGERKRVDERKTYGHGHRKTELLVECTCGTAHEADRNEHGHEYECSSHESHGYAAHCLYCSLVSRLASLVKPGLYGLHDHDGVIDDRSDHQHQRKERDHVEAESGHHEEGECSHKGNDDRYCRDDCGTKALKEDEDHEDNEEDGLEKSLDHIFDGCVKEVLRTHQVYDLKAFRKVSTDFFYHLVHCHDDLVGVRT